MICPVCRGTSFYEDDGGEYFCSRCNTQSQELFAESFDLEEGMGNQDRTGFVRVRQLKEPKGQGRRRSETPFIELEVYLLAYQWCLRHLAESTSRIAGIPSLVERVQPLWIRYLQRWRASGVKMQPAFTAYTSGYEEYFGRGTALPQPILPTKHLLLGFVYLAARQLGASLIPADLVRWSFEGRLPFANYLEVLPADLKEPLGENVGRIFLRGENLTTTNIFFHTYMLAESLEVSLPCLNAPLVARSILSALGMPLGCWTAFCAMTQLFRNVKPLPSLDFLEEHYPERIMAACICAMKLQRHWTSWEYVAAPERERTSLVPRHISELDLVPRKHLDQLLERIGDSLPKMNKKSTVKSHNDGVATFLDNNPSFYHSHLEVRETATFLPIIVNRDSVRELRKSAGDKRHIHQLFNLPNPRGRFTLDGGLFGPYVTYTENLEDVTGLLLPQYTVLLERCARHMCTSPGLLHLLVQRIDKTVVALLHEREKARSMFEVEALCDRYSSKLSRRKLTRSKEYDCVSKGVGFLKRFRRGYKLRSASWPERLRYYYKRGMPASRFLNDLIDASSNEGPKIIKEESNLTYLDDEHLLGENLRRTVSIGKGEQRVRNKANLRDVDALSQHFLELRRDRKIMRRREFRLPPIVLQMKNGNESIKEGVEFGLEDFEFDNSDESVSTGNGSTEEEEDDEGTDDGSSNTDRMMEEDSSHGESSASTLRAGDGLADSSSGLDEFSEDRSDVGGSEGRGESSLGASSANESESTASVTGKEVHDDFVTNESEEDSDSDSIGN